MAEYRRQIVTTSVVAIVLALSIGIGIYYMQPQLSGMATTRTTTINSSYAMSAQTTNSSSRLRLELSMNATTMSLGETIDLNVALYNTLSELNNLSAANDWAIGGLNLGPCGSLNYPFGFAVFQGYYSSSNVSGAHPLNLYNPSAMYACPAIFYVKYYVFEPTSEDGSIYVQSSNGTQQCCYEHPGQPFPMTGSLQVNTYWGNEDKEHNLSPGAYTVVGGDEWGDMIILHFVVSTLSTGPPGVTDATNPTLGLELQLSMNSTIYYLGENVSVNIMESNILAANNNVSAASDWPVQGLSIGPCGTIGSPIGLAIFQGYYAVSNISSARSLQLYEPGTYFCPGSSLNIASYEFQPSSDSGLVCSDYPSSCQGFNASVEVSASGYWFNATVNNAQFLFTPFGAGTYTVATGDEWGDTALLHFIVNQ